MNLNDYQQQAKTTAFYPKLHDAPVYPTLGLVGESGEVAEKVKKWVRDGKFNVEDILYELGDAMWYIANIADDLGYGLETVARMNIEKLASRQRRNKLHGEGDNR